MAGLHFHRFNAPQRKFRGKRRYFARVEREAEAFAINPGPQDWWDLWHYHADWRGWGNLGWRCRLPHILALCTVFRKICDARDRFHIPFQTLISIDGQDAGQDATYLHTTNANGTAFPTVLADVEWQTSALQPVMDSLLPDLELEVGWSRTKKRDDDAGPEWSATHWVYARGVGVPPRVG